MKYILSTRNKEEVMSKHPEGHEAGLRAWEPIDRRLNGDLWRDLDRGGRSQDSHSCVHAA